MARPVVHFEICARDAQKAHDFYETLFDWKINIAEGMPYHLVESAGDGSIPGGIVSGDAATAVPGFAGRSAAARRRSGGSASGVR